MKMFSGFVVIVFLAPFLSGCASCPCEKNAENVPPSETSYIAVAPVAAPVVQETAPVVSAAPVETAEDSVPVKVRKYVSK